MDKQDPKDRKFSPDTARKIKESFLKGDDLGGNIKQFFIDLFGLGEDDDAENDKPIVDARQKALEELKRRAEQGLEEEE